MHFQNRQTRLGLSVFAFGAVVRSLTDFIVLTADFTTFPKFEKRYISDDDFVTDMTDEYEQDMYTYVYESSDGTRGIVAVPFSEDAPDSVTLYVSTYDKNANVMSDNVRYTAELDENGVMKNVVKLDVTAENKKIICTGTVNGNDYRIFVWEKGTCVPVMLSYSNK